VRNYMNWGPSAGEVRNAEVKTSRLVSCLASGDGRSRNDRAAVYGSDQKTLIERHISSSVTYLDHSKTKPTIRTLYIY